MSQKCCYNQGQPKRDGQRSANSRLRIYTSFLLVPSLTEQMTIECSLCVRLCPGLWEVSYKQDKIHALKSMAYVTGDLLSKLLFMKTQEVSFFLWDRVLCTRGGPPPCCVDKDRLDHIFYILYLTKSACAQGQLHNQPCPSGGGLNCAWRTAPNILEFKTPSLFLRQDLIM